MSLLAVSIPYWGQSLLRVLGVLLVVLLPAGTLVYLFLFKMMSFMQSRLGPMEAGPYGSLQLFAEVGKFIQKEDISPRGADLRIFRMAPYVVVLTVFLIYVAVPFGPDAVFADFEVGVFYVLAVSSISVLGILMAGWASANKYSLIGGLRAAGQLIAYELPMVLAVVGVVIQAETMNMQGIVAAQSEGAIFGIDIIGSPYVITQFLGFVIFMIAIQAELTQTPFDMPIAESELVAGYMTEYSGFRFLLFFIGEFAAAGAFAAVAATLFLGGWALPGAWFDQTEDFMNVVGPLVLLGKLVLLAGIIFWIRFTYPRFREDQLQRFAWKVLIPLALANIMVTAVFKVALLMPKVPGVIKGLGVTLGTMARTITQGANTVQYPREKEAPPTRARGVIALREENCTVCMLCARSCPDWCIYIEGHKEKAPPRRPGGKPRTVSALDRFDIDYALCMYCGICVEVCPFDALFWSPEYEYSEPRIADLLHDKDKLGEWMETVPEAPDLEVGADKKGKK